MSSSGAGAARETSDGPTASPARSSVDEGDEDLEKLERRGKAAAQVVTELRRHEVALREATAAAAAQAESMRAWIDSQERVGVVGGAAALTLSTGGAAVRRGASLGGAGGDSTPSPAAAGGPRQVSVEDVVLPVSTLQAQLFDCVAEDSAIEDLYFHLDDALRKGAWRCSKTRVARGCSLILSALIPGRVDVDAVLREARELGRKQFRARAIAKAIDAALAVKRGATSGGPGTAGGMPMPGSVAPLASGGGGGALGSGGAAFSGYPSIDPAVRAAAAVRR